MGACAMRRDSFVEVFARSFVVWSLSYFNPARIKRKNIEPKLG